MWQNTIEGRRKFLVASDIFGISNEQEAGFKSTPAVFDGLIKKFKIA